MAYSGPNGESVRKNACQYSLKAALDEVTHMRFVDAFEYFNIAEMVAGSELDLLCPVLKHVRETVVILTDLEKESNKCTFYTYVKDAQSIVFGKSLDRFYREEMVEQKTARTDSISTVDSDGSSLEGYMKLKAKLELKVRALAVGTACVTGPCGEEDIQKKKPVSCCVIS